MAQSITEAEYVAIAEGAKDAEWCRQLLKEIGLNPTITIYTDNEAALKLTKTQTFHRRTRHRTQISLYPGSSQEGETEILGIKGKENPADILTILVPMSSTLQWKNRHLIV